MDRNISRLPKNSLLTVSKSREKLEGKAGHPIFPTVPGKI
jgi:hypothetical protein